MKIVAFSDVHGHCTDFLRYTRPVVTIPEDTDILIFAGDYSFHSNYISSLLFVKWFAQQLGKYKILVPGNHDYYLEDVPKVKGVFILIHDYIKVMGVKIFGTPYTPEFCSWNYMAEEEDLINFFDMIPEDIDILISHGPAYGLLDGYKNDGYHIGSKSLRTALQRVQPDIMIHGHYHKNGYTKYGPTDIYNVSILDDNYNPQWNVTEINL